MGRENSSASSKRRTASPARPSPAAIAPSTLSAQPMGPASPTVRPRASPSPSKRAAAGVSPACSAAAPSETRSNASSRRSPARRAVSRAARRVARAAACVPAALGGHGEVALGERQQAQVAGRPGHGHALLEQLPVVGVAVDRGQPPGPVQGQSAGDGRRRRAVLEGVAQPEAPLAARAVEVPEAPEGPDQAQLARRVAGGPAALQCRPEVVVLEGHPPQPAHLVVADELGGRALRPADRPGQVARTGRRRLAGLRQALGAVAPDRLQQAVALLAAAGLRLGEHERLVHQSGEQVDHGERGHRARRRLPGVRAFRGVRAHRLGRLQRPAPGEDRQPAQQGPLGRGEQLVAPVQGRRQRPVPGQGGPAAARQQPEAVVQPGRDLLHRQRPHPGRRQLDRQGDAVQPAADLGHRGRVRARRGRSRARPPGPARRTGAPPRRPPAGRRGRRPAAVRQTASEGTRQTTSPATPSGSRLVARTRSRGQALQQRLRRARRRRRAGARSCPAPAAGGARRRPPPGPRSGGSRAPRARRGLRPPPGAPARGSPAGRGRRRPPPRRRSAAGAGDGEGQAGLADPARAGEGQQARPPPGGGRLPASRRCTSPSSQSRPTKLVRGAGRGLPAAGGGAGGGGAAVEGASGAAAAPRRPAPARAARASAERRRASARWRTVAG